MVVENPPFSATYFKRNHCNRVDNLIIGARCLVPGRGGLVYWDLPSREVLRWSARTTAAVRRAIQHSQESLNRLSAQYGISPKTVAKWRKRESVQDAPMGSSKPCSTVLTAEQEALVVAFRKLTLLPLDDCLDRVCMANGIEHRLTKINHPGPTDQVERMNRTLKEATAKKFFYQTLQHLKERL